jgi:DNA repair protein RecO (recombination protein O)
MSESVVTDALLLRAVDYRDSDRILTLFTADRGKLSAIARGAKNSRRRFPGALEPYTLIRVELELGKGELFTLKRAEIVRVFPALLADLSRMEVAAAALMLLREAHAVHVPDVQAFVSALQFLTLIDHEPDPTRAALLAYAMRVLALAGLAPRLATCGRSEEVVPDGKAAYFDPALGALIGKRFGGGPFLLPWVVRERLLLAQGERWLEVARLPWQDEVLSGARCALAAFIASHLSPDLAGRLFPDS